MPVKDIARKGVDLAYEMARTPLTASENISQWFREEYKKGLPQEMTEEERQSRVAAGPPTLGQAVGRGADLVTEMASMVPGTGQEMALGKVAGAKVAAPLLGAIATPKRMKVWQKLLKSVSRRSPGLMAAPDVKGMEKAVQQIERMIPEEFWKRQVKDIILETLPVREGAYHQVGKQGIIRINKIFGNPQAVGHEVGHAVSHYLFNTAAPGSSLARLRNRWEVLRRTGQKLDELIEPDVIRKMKHLTTPERMALLRAKDINYQVRSEEVFARAFQKAVDDNQSLREAAKVATKAVHVTIERSQKALKSIRGLVQDMAKKDFLRGKSLATAQEALDEAEELSVWFKSPAHRRGKLMGQLQDMFIKENPKATVRDANEFYRNIREMDTKRLRRIWLGQTEGEGRDIVKEMAR